LAIGFFAMAAGFFLAFVVVVVVVVVVDVCGVAAVCANNGAETINRRMLASQDLIVSLPLYLGAAGPNFTDGGFELLAHHCRLRPLNTSAESPLRLLGKLGSAQLSRQT
jgi:hypothetical protein